MAIAARHIFGAIAGFACIAAAVLGGFLLWQYRDGHAEAAGSRPLRTQRPVELGEHIRKPDDRPPPVARDGFEALRNTSLAEAERNDIANSLLGRDNRRLVAELTEMLWDERESPKWRNYCVQHLYACYEKQPDPAIPGTLFKAAQCDEKMVRICAVWSLARVATPRDRARIPDEDTLGGIHALALQALREKNTHFLITEAGVQSCARLGLTEALPEIRALAGSDDTKPTHLRVVAVAALGELKDAESAHLLERLSNEATGQLQAAAQLALKRVKEAEGADQPELAPEDRF